MESIFIGRQPILERDGTLYGYELLHRRNPEGGPALDGDNMSSDMLVNAVLEVGIEQISGSHRAFINLTRNLLMNRGLDVLPPDRIVLEVLEDVPVDVHLIDRLHALRERGFEIALDDFVHSPAHDPLIDLADIVKLDVLALDEAALERHADLLRRRNVRLLAEKVETPAMHERLLALGFELFQGFYFARPQLYTGKKILPSRLVLIELLARVNEPNIGPEDLAGIIRGDVAMCVTVLRWANGSVYGLRRPVESVERAIVVLGLQTIRNWVALLALARSGTSPSELLRMLLVRARTCELLAGTAERDNPSGYFTVGLLSGIDIVLQMDMVQVLDRLRLEDDQNAALLARGGDQGEALRSVIALEAGLPDQAHFAGLDATEITRCYLSAIAWADNLSRAAM